MASFVLVEQLVVGTVFIPELFALGLILFVISWLLCWRVLPLVHIVMSLLSCIVPWNALDRELLDVVCIGMLLISLSLLELSLSVIIASEPSTIP
jgi:hypothetical protein